MHMYSECNIYTYVYMECISTYVDIVRVLMCMYV